jgi:hypothetical protein
MEQLFTAVLEVADPDFQPVQNAACRGYQPANQPAAQLNEQSRKELSPVEASGVEHDLGQDEHFTLSGGAGAYSQGDVTRLSHPKDDLDYQQLIEVLTTFKDNNYFANVEHLGSESDVSGDQASGQVQNEASFDPVHQISRKLQELQIESKELDNLLHMKMACNRDQLSASDETKSQPQTGTAEEEQHVEQERSTNRTETCNLTDPKSEESTVSKSQIERHSRGEKTTFDASRLEGISIPDLWQTFGRKLYDMCYQLQVGCKNLSSKLLTTLNTFVVGSIMKDHGAKQYLHQAEILSILIGCLSELRSALRHTADYIGGCSIKEIACLIYTVKRLIAIFPLLERACWNLYNDYVHLQPDCQKDSGAGKSVYAEDRWKADEICQKIDMAGEQLEEAAQKLNIINDIEAGDPEIPEFPLQPEAPSTHRSSKKTFFTVARKLLLIEEHISSLIGARTFQGRVA